ENVRVSVRTPSGEQQVEGSDILVATGRAPNTQDIGLDQAGVALDGRGFIRVNDRLETSAPGVWAMGDCAGSPQFTHVAGDDFRIVRENLAGGNESTRPARSVLHVYRPAARACGLERTRCAARRCRDSCGQVADEPRVADRGNG